MLLADCGYGDVGEFRGGLDARDVGYVVEVRVDTSAYGGQERPTVVAYSGMGRRLRPRYYDRPCSLTRLALQAEPQACVDLIWRRGSKGCNVAGSLRCGCARPGSPHAVRLATAAPSCRCAGCWSSGRRARPRRVLAVQPGGVEPIVELVRLARLRWRIEQDYRECKGALGLDHFEGRSFKGWHLT